MAAPMSVLFKDHFIAPNMGVYTREIRFKEKVMLHKVQILGRSERPQDGSSFEGKTFPDVRTMSASVFAADISSANTTMPRLRTDTAGTFVPADGFVTDAVVIKGEFMKLSVVVYGRKLEAEEMPDISEHEMAGVAAHLRPEHAFLTEKLDLADWEGADELEQDEVLDGPDVFGPGEGSAAASLVRGLALGSSAEADAKVLENAAWVQSLVSNHEVTEDEMKVVQKLEELASELWALAKSAPDASAGLVAHGPALARALINLQSRCLKRSEFRALRSVFHVLAAALCAASTAVEVLRCGGLAVLLGVIRDQEFFSVWNKLAALQALSQLCSHAVGMEAFLGWSSVGSDVPADGGKSGTAYECIVAMTADGKPGFHRLEEICLMLLKRAALYVSLARLDDCCARLAPDKRSSDDGGDAASDDVITGVVEALAEVAAQFEQLSTEAPRDESLLEDSCPSIFSSDSLENSSSSLSSDSFGHVHPQLHGFLESFLAGRRLIPALNLLLRRLRGETKLAELSARERVAVFVPLRRLICAILACVGGAQFLAADAPALQSFLSLLDGGKGGKKTGSEVFDLPAVPRFPVSTAQSMIGAQQLASLVTIHIRATKLTFTLVSRTRQRGVDGLLPEGDALNLLCALHRLCSRGPAGRDSVVCAFRSVFLIEWLLRQIEGRLKEIAPSGVPQAGNTVPSPSLRHLIAVLHTITLSDPLASVADKFGGLLLPLCERALEVLESSVLAGIDSGDRGGAMSSSLEFALDSDGQEGGLGKAVRVGRHSPDVACLTQLRELIAQLRPWQQSEGEIAPPMAAESLPVGKLLACFRMPRAPRGFKRSVDEQRVSRLSMQLGGYCGLDSAIEVAEVDFAADTGEHGETVVEERIPPSDMTEIPLLAMRLLRRRASKSSRDAVEVVLTTDTASATGSSAIASIVPVLIRCLSTLNLNLEALMLQEDKGSIDEVCASQEAHAQLLEAALQACYHMLKGLRAAGLSQFRSTDLLHVLLLLADRLTSNLVGLSPCSFGVDPEFHLLWRQCLTWVCSVFRVWIESFPDFAAGQLLQPLLRHTRVLQFHFAPGLLFLGTCGSLKPLAPHLPCSYKLATGSRGSGDALPGEQIIQSHPILLPETTRGGAIGHMTATVKTQGNHAPFSKESERAKLWGQLWGIDWEPEDWDMVESGPRSAAFEAVCDRDVLVRALSGRPEHGGAASVLALVGHVNARRERFSMDDLGELVALVAQCALTANAFVHLVTVRVLHKLTAAGMPVLSLILKVGEAALGADADQFSFDGDAQMPSSNPTARDPRDARAVSRILMLLTHFGQQGDVARSALVEHRAENLCFSVLAAHSPLALPATAATQAIRVLALMFCPNAARPRHTREGNNEASSSTSSLLQPSVPKCRMVTKALSQLLDRQQGGGPSVGPAAIGASLELLLSLSKERSMCLNLLFSAGGNEAESNGSTVSVSVSCAFRLSQCSSRLARELAVADEDWDKSAPGSEGEAEAEEVLQSWLYVGELLINLCTTVALHCPTVSVFLAVMSASGSPPERIDEAALQSVLADVSTVLSKLCLRTKHENKAVPMRAATLVGNLRAFSRQLDEINRAPPPKTLSREEFCPAWLDPLPAKEKTLETATGKSNDSSSSDHSEEACNDDVLEEIVSLFAALSDLEADPEWKNVAELDDAFPPVEGTSISWEFDAGAHRKKRKELIDKEESDRVAKKLKQAQSQRTGSDRDVKDARSTGKEAPRRDKSPEAKAATVTETAIVPVPAKVPESTPATTTTTVATTTPAAEPPSNPAPDSKAQALQKFLKDNPQFMRVLQNPKKTLSDPRVKSMFLKELNANPQVKAFFAEKGLVV